MTQDQDIDRWSERLAGREPAAPGDIDGSAELRRAIQNVDRTATDEGGRDELGLQRLMRRLDTEGLLEPAASPASIRRGGVRWLALAATVAAVAIGVRLLTPAATPEGPSTPAPSGEVSRGFAGVVKQHVPDPRSAASTASADLTALGLEVREVPADGRVILETDVSEGALDAFRAWVEPRGGRVLTPGRYRIIFEPPS